MSVVPDAQAFWGRYAAKTETFAGVAARAAAQAFALGITLAEAQKLSDAYFPVREKDEDVG